ncbi:NUMOD4 domain-containing protein [Bacillus licheniformis]|uniref:NUMOD4 domain-containing protein n=1 Tax=Bacillus licheniformis TaxID=1402 RepID=UPI001CD7184B|nr:NUMOD4 domain-containing protein [Bacillus licheniformis]MCA1184625.1 HNH endonuclease [Bacillus licheniformis]MCY7954765.1 NUMOD4 domain-containing protein [Bacillus licheniformis]
MKEEWRRLKGLIDCGDSYEVSNLGNVRNYLTGKQLKPRDKRGYLQVVLWLNNRRKDVNVHRLVALAFLEKDAKRNYVNHMDGDKKNNKISNLEWVTPRENKIHAWQTGLIDPQQHRDLMKKLHSKPVSKINSDGLVLATYESGVEASKDTGVRRDTISKQCILRRKSRSKNFYFRFASDISEGVDYYR